MKTANDIDKKTTAIEKASSQFSVIDTDDKYVGAGEMLKGVKGLIAEIGKAFDPIIEKAHLAHKEAISQKRKQVEPLDRIEGFLKIRIAEYLRLREELKEREEARLRRLAEQQEEERRMIEAANLIDQGRDNEASELLEQKIDVGTIAVAETEKPVVVMGINSRKIYTAEALDIIVLLRAILDGKAPLQAILVNQVYLNQRARADKEAFNIPGCRLVKETSISSTKE